MLSIIIVSFNTKDLLLACLRSIIRARAGLDLEIIIVDNGSTDGTIALVKSHFPQAILIENHQNVGFGKANNQAAKRATKDYLFFLNSDTTLNQDTLSILVETLHSQNPDFASMKLLNPDHSIQPQGGHLPNLFNIFAWMFFLDDIPILGRLLPAYQIRRRSFFTHDHRMGWVGGTAMIAKRQTFLELGGFDEAMFMYGEDVELCYRISLAGKKIHYLSRPWVFHQGQGSGTSSAAIVGEYTGLIYLFSKHKPAWQLSILKIYLKIGARIRYVLFGIMGGNESKRVAYQEALKMVG